MGRSPRSPRAEVERLGKLMYGEMRMQVQVNRGAKQRQQSKENKTKQDGQGKRRCTRQGECDARHSTTDTAAGEAVGYRKLAG